ncbi:NAD(+) diphosphatase [Luteimonas dalianensis]|uniref:NAD(+) diphosphatase n=1 Tax=Luteimonas dalianensis TaxID=1148196 RepID=UPI003BF332A9
MAAMAFSFVDAPLDRAEHLRSNPSGLAALWPQARLLLLDGEGLALADAQDALLAVSGGDVAAALPADAVFLGLDDGRGWFALPAESAGLPAPRRIALRAAAAAWPVREATAFAQARAVLHWRSRHRYCGACGGELAFERAGWLGRCGRCAIEHYPRTDPAVIVSVSDGERLLLGREATWPAGRWSVLAGFVEPGETLEQTVLREVFEESAVRVTACRYLASQPWPFPSSLMLGFEADAGPDEPVPNTDELEAVRWFTREEIGAALRGEGEIQLSPRISISRWLIERWHARPRN